ncbi:MAG: Lrp/AsnC family transcriptional regulator [Candidatus Sumerlaeia bacterium]
MPLDAIDEALLNMAQGNFPLKARPFRALGEAHGLSEKDCIARFQAMREGGLIRYFGPVIATKALGFQSSLCAFKVPPERIEAAAETVSSHPGVSHNYERENAFNLWFTLAVPPDLNLERDFEILRDRAQAESALLLPALQTFKIRMVLNVSESKHSSPKEPDQSDKSDTPSPEHSPLTSTEKALLARIEPGLDFVARPFAEAAAAVNRDEADVLAILSSLIDRGILRRLGVLLHHRRAGFQHNEMTAWQAPPDAIVEWGRALAAMERVSHCYERPAHPEWPYNLYAMIHAHSPEEFQQILDDARAKLDCPTEPQRLRSIREFKKQRLQYFTDAYYKWNRPTE